jgi:hypothetical protein
MNRLLLIFVLIITAISYSQEIIILDKIGGSEETVTVKKVDEGEAISFKVSSQTGVIPKSQNLPLGSTYSTANGIFSWMPSESQSGMYALGFYLGDPTLPNFVYKNLRIVVADTIFRIPINVKFEHLFMATDPDNEAVSITATNLPSGSTFVGSQYSPKLFTWKPTVSQVGTYIITITASDNGSPPQYDTKRITITVVKLSYDDMQYDFNKDGVIDIQDYAMFAAHWTGSDTGTVDKKKIIVYYTMDSYLYHKQDCVLLGDYYTTVLSAKAFDAERYGYIPDPQCRPLEVTYTNYPKKVSGTVTPPNNIN